MDKGTKRNFTVRVDVELLRSIRAVAVQQDLSVSKLISNFFEDYVESRGGLEIQDLRDALRPFAELARAASLIFCPGK